MSIRPVNITLDCENPEQVAAFWSKALESDINDGASPFFCALHHEPSGMNFFFIKVPENRTTKNRMHLDYEAAEAPAEVERLVALGATKIADKDEWGHQWTVMNDIEGNEFCVSGPHV